MEDIGKDRIEESTIVRGIAAAIQAMQFPTFKNLRDLLSKFGYRLSEKNKQL